MTLTTHAIVGAAATTAAVTALGATPAGLALGFAAGFASHFALDAIPHWDEGGALLRSGINDSSGKHMADMRFGKAFIRDLSIVAADACLGLILSFFVFSVWFFHIPPLVVLIGVVAGITPDPLQFIYFKTRWRFMRPLQNFHSRIQKELVNPLTIVIEVVLAVIVVAVLKFFV